MTTTQNPSDQQQRDYLTMRDLLTSAHTQYENQANALRAENWTAEDLTWNQDQELRSLDALRRSVDARIEDVVLHMRARRKSWAEIAHALGVTKQAAQQKYGRSA